MTRNPVVAFGDSLADDLVRRDFTVNAMAVSLPATSPASSTRSAGWPTLAAGVLDTPATPEESFGDDPLRMLRAARFVSQLGFTPAPRVVAAMTAMAGEIARITAERVRAELDEADAAARTRGAGSRCWSTPGWPTRAARAAGAAAGASTSTTSTRTSTSTR